VAWQPLAAGESVKLEHNAEPGDAVARPLGEARRRGESASRGQHIVENQHARARGQMPRLELQLGRAVLQLVTLGQDLAGQLAGLADDDEACVRGVRGGCGENEAARLHAGDRVKTALETGEQFVRDRTERRGIREHRGKVTKEDAGFGKIGDAGKQSFDGGGCGFMAHPSTLDVVARTPARAGRSNKARIGRVTEPVETDAPIRKPLFADLTPLKQSKPFARLWVGGAISGIGSQMTIVAIGLQIYDLTASTLAVALVALFALVPMIIFGLYGGMLADAFDRRTVALIAAIVAWTSTATIATLAWLQVETVWPLYLLTTVNAVASTVIGSTRAAILPRLLPASLLPAASALQGISTGVMITLGPALAGVLVATVGFGWTYTVDVLLFVAAFMGIATLPHIVPEGGSGRPGLRSLVDGIRFLKSAPNVRMTFIVDIIAMTFGQPRVLYPAVGALLLGGGAITVGILTAAFAVGALLSSVFSGPLGHVRMQGRAIGRAIMAFGASTLAFGLVLAVMATGWFGPVSSDIADANVPAIVLACVFLAAAGASDNISAIFRMTILQAAVPDAMRGRIQGVFTVVVTGGPRLGDLFAGFLTVVAALWFPPVLGGIVIMVAILLVVRLQRSFRAYDAKNPTP
jgi:MFS family permease